MSSPKLLAMLSKQPPIEGDDALLKLARERLAEAGLGGELYVGSPDHLQQMLNHRPNTLPCTAHLPRNVNLLQKAGRETLMEYAGIAAGRLYGLVVHDQLEFAQNPEETQAALRETDWLLSRQEESPLLFIEYAVGLDPSFYAGLFERCSETRKLSAALDVGHLGIRVCRTAFMAQYPDRDVCELWPESPELPEKISAVQQATRMALPAVLDLIESLSKPGKPLHFHLHDGHPLSTLSRFGVSDHLSFLQQIRLPFEYRGLQLLPGMFGLSGLQAIIRKAKTALPADRLSFLLEMHPQPGQTPLGVHEPLFSHWQQKENAEMMNHWLDTMIHNASLVRAAWDG
jgi:hypothetical protein